MSSVISVLLADDHAILRKCLHRALDDDPELLVVGTAADGFEAVELTLALAPRVVVMDMAMPVMDGLEATRRIRRTMPGTAVLMLSLNGEERSVRSAFDAGASGYVMKNAAGLDLAGAIKAVAMGERVLDLGAGEPLPHARHS